MTRREGHEGCPPCQCAAPYGEHCRHEHDAWLTVRDQMTLQLAGATYRHEGAREADALETLGYSPTRFRQVVGKLLDDPVAMAEEPMVVRRLLRIRDRRRAARWHANQAVVSSGLTAGETVSSGA